MIQQEIQNHTQYNFQQQIDNFNQQNQLIEQDFDSQSVSNEMYNEDFEEQNEEDNEQTDVVSNQVLLKQLEKLKLQVQEICCIKSDNALELLRYYKWKIKKLEEEYFQYPNYILLELQKSGDYNNHDSVSYPEDHDKPEPCQICQYESPLIQLGCKHKICQNCLQQLIIQKIQEGEKKIPCLIENCVYKLPTSMISSLISKKVVDDLLVQEFVSSSDELIVCINEKCQRILKRPNTPFLIVTCACEQTFCFKCKLENHAPASCEIAKNWLLDIEDIVIGNYQVEQQLDKKGHKEFQYYQEEYSKIQNSFQFFQTSQIVDIQNINLINESEVQTILKVFQEILSILLFLKWVVCLEFTTKKMSTNFYQQIKCNKMVLVIKKDILFQLLDQFFLNLLPYDNQIHQDSLKEFVRILGANRVICENQRKMFEQDLLQFQLI